MALIYLAGGCFWGTEKYLGSIKGVLSTTVGYANGNTENPTYEQVCNENTGHAEAVRVEYDDKVLPLEFLLALFYDSIDPTTENRQGGDVGRQYRSGVYYTDKADLETVQSSIEKLAAKHDKPIKVEVLPLENFYAAEEYHQKYLDKNPFGYCHIPPSAFARAAAAVVNPADYAAPGQEELLTKLSPLQYEVTQNSATEPPFENEYNTHYLGGIYVDITTGEPLFASTDKFNSGSGWPSFTKPIDPNTVREKIDLSHGRVRTEVRSRVGDAHLGHVFEDGPPSKGGMRYCINSAALRFVPLEEMESQGYGYLKKLIKK